MEGKNTLIIALIILVIYLYYQQTQQKNLPIQPDNQELQELKTQLNHYQTLYQKRVEKDLEVDQSQKIKELTESNRQLTEEFQNYKTIAEKEKKTQWRNRQSHSPCGSRWIPRPRNDWIRSINIDDGIPSYTT